MNRAYLIDLFERAAVTALETFVGVLVTGLSASGIIDLSRLKVLALSGIAAGISTGLSVIKSGLAAKLTGTASLIKARYVDGAHVVTEAPEPNVTVTSGQIGCWPPLSSEAISYGYPSEDEVAEVERVVTLGVPKLNRYGLIPDLPDARDHHATKVTKARIAKLPPVVDLRTDPRMPKVWNQLDLGACTAHGIAAALIFHELIEVMPSRLFLYYGERKLEGTISSDSGAQIRDGIKFVASQGVCPESEWPYDITRFTQRPPAKCWTDSKQAVALSYQRVARDVDQIRAQLAQGNLVVIGFSVYESFESQTVAETGIMPLPKKGEQLLGGHCVAIVGYQHSTKRFIVRNSWSDGWGQQGYFLMPYGVISNAGLSSDFWTISRTGPK